LKVYFDTLDFDTASELTTLTNERNHETGDKTVIDQKASVVVSARHKQYGCKRFKPSTSYNTQVEVPYDFQPPENLLPLSMLSPPVSIEFPRTQLIMVS
jgi:hypothetical protein